MASLTRWTWAWVNSGSWWWTGRPGVLWFMGSQRVRHDWVTEQNWTELYRHMCLHAKLLQLYPTLCDIMDCSCQAPLSVGYSGKNGGVGCHGLLQGIFPTQGSNPQLLYLLHWKAGSLPLAQPGKSLQVYIPSWTCLLYVDPPAVETLSFLFFIISNSHVLQGHLHEASQFSPVCSDVMLLWSHSSIVWITQLSTKCSLSRHHVIFKISFRSCCC